MFLWTQIWKGIAGMLFNFGMRAIKQQCKLDKCPTFDIVPHRKYNKI